MIDVKELKRKLDLRVEKETAESLNAWLDKERSKDSKVTEREIDPAYEIVTRNYDELTLPDEPHEEMQTVIVNIMNPKAEALLKNLEDMSLITIGDITNAPMGKLLMKFFAHEESTLSDQEIIAEVNAVRKSYWEKWHQEH